MAPRILQEVPDHPTQQAWIAANRDRLTIARRLVVARAFLGREREEIDLLVPAPRLARIRATRRRPADAPVSPAPGARPDRHRRRPRARAARALRTGRGPDAGRPVAPARPATGRRADESPRRAGPPNGAASRRGRGPGPARPAAHRRPRAAFDRRRTARRRHEDSPRGAPAPPAARPSAPPSVAGRSGRACPP